MFPKAPQHDRPDVTGPDRPAGNEAASDAGGPTPGRGEMVGLALQIDAIAARSEEIGLDLVAYLLGVARAELGERLGERPGALRQRPADGAVAAVRHAGPPVDRGEGRSDD